LNGSLQGAKADEPLKSREMTVADTQESRLKGLYFLAIANDGRVQEGPPICICFGPAQYLQYHIL
jgi:hypothetical protein